MLLLCWKLFFHKSILNVNKIDVVDFYKKKIICKHLLICFKFTSLIFETKPRSVCRITAIHFGVQFLSGQSVVDAMFSSSKTIYL